MASHTRSHHVLWYSRRWHASVVPLPRMEYAPDNMSSAVTTIAPATELNLRGNMTHAARTRWAVADVAGGLRLWRLAWALGWLDIRLRYRGSMLGPFWLTISTGVMVAASGRAVLSIVQDRPARLPAIPGVVAGTMGLPRCPGVRGLYHLHRRRRRHPLRAHAVLRILDARADPEHHCPGSQHRCDRSCFRGLRVVAEVGRS